MRPLEFALAGNSGMAITKQKKEEIRKDLEDKFSQHKSVVFIDYGGLDVASMETIRSELHNEGVDLKIAKKTLLDLVLKKMDIKVDVSALSGQVAIVFGYKDEVAPARIINKFVKEFESLTILGGIIDNGFIPTDRVVELANIPSYDELLGKMVGSMQAPIVGFMNVMQGNTRGLVQVLSAISSK